MEKSSLAPWSEKYRPQKLKDIAGQDAAIQELLKWIKNFKKEKNKAVILHGPAGNGKTSLAQALANELNYELIQMNASDFRTENAVMEKVGHASLQHSLVGKRGKIILIDEVDGISSGERGGLSELITLIESSTYPIIITANDAWKKNLAPLRKISEIIQIKEIDYKIIREIMIEILKKRNHFIGNDSLTRIAIRAKGDLRAAINDLQSLSYIKDPSQILSDERNKETDIFNAMRLIFKGKPTQDTLKIFDSVNMPIDEIMLWIEENIPAEYDGKELARAYDLVSKTDIFKWRINMQQYWRFLIYENIFLSYGISSAKKTNQIPKSGFTSYKKPTRILKIWMNNQKNARKKSISQKYAKYAHVSEKKAMSEFQLIKNILKNHSVQKELKLTEDEIMYLEK